MLASFLTLLLCLQIATQTPGTPNPFTESIRDRTIKIPAFAAPQHWEFWIRIPIDRHWAVEIKDMTPTPPGSGFGLTYAAVYGKTALEVSTWHKLTEAVVLEHRRPDAVTWESGHSKVTIYPHPFVASEDGLFIRFIVLQHSYVNMVVVLTMQCLRHNTVFEPIAMQVKNYAFICAKPLREIRSSARRSTRQFTPTDMEDVETSSQQAHCLASTADIEAYLMEDEIDKLSSCPSQQAWDHEYGSYKSLLEGR